MGGRREEDRKTQRENFYAFLAILASGCLEVLASKNWLWSILLAYLSNFRAKGFVRTQSLRIRITVSWHIVFVFRIVGLNPLPRVPRLGGLIWMLMVVGRKGRFQGADKKACIPAELAR